MTRRVRRTVAGVLTLLVALVGYGVAIEPRVILVIDRQTAVLPHLPPAWNGRRVAVISDLQIGMWGGNTTMAARAVQTIVAAHPAAVFVLGDIVAAADASLPDELRTARQVLRPLAVAHLPTYAVLGNHDGVDASAAASHPQEAAQVRQTLTALGLHVLENTAALLPPPGRPGAAGRPGGVYVVGLVPPWTPHQQPSAALRTVPRDAARLVIMHEPDTFLSLPPGSAPLGLAGHTHCGQVRLPFPAGWSWLMLVEPHPVQDGWNEHFGQRGNRLYVTCGVGLSVVPLRLNDPPQLTLLTLLQRPPAGRAGS